MFMAKQYCDDTQHLVNLAALLVVFSLISSITDNHLAAVRKTGLSDYKELACTPYINSESFGPKANDWSLVRLYFKLGSLIKETNSDEQRKSPINTAFA
jgi:hypothetical protein